MSEQQVYTHRNDRWEFDATGDDFWAITKLSATEIEFIELWHGQIVIGMNGTAVLDAGVWRVVEGSEPIEDFVDIAAFFNEHGAPNELNTNNIESLAYDNDIVTTQLSPYFHIRTSRI